MNDSDDTTPHLVRSEEVFSGRVFSVTRDEVEEGEGRTFVREIVRHAGSACILPLFADDTIALVRQYRHPARVSLLEIPAGSIEAGEAPEACAHRELEEEIGVRADSLSLISEFYPSPGFLSEKMWVYLATELHTTAQRLDEDERVEVVRLPLRQALLMIESGDIRDAKTIIALALLASCLGGAAWESVALSQLRVI